MNDAPTHTKPTMRRWTTAALSLSGVALVAACGSSLTGSSTSSAPPPSTTPAGTPAGGTASGTALPCAQITALRSTLTDLSHTSVSPTSATRIASDLTKAEQQLSALKSEGTGTFTAQANQLSNALTAIKRSATALANSPTPSNLANLTNAVTTFKFTSEPLIKEMQTLCP